MHLEANFHSFWLKTKKVMKYFANQLRAHFAAPQFSNFWSNTDLANALAICRMHFYGLHLTQTVVLAKWIQEKTMASLKSRTLKNSIFPFFDCCVLGAIFWMLIPESLEQISTFIALNIIPQCLSNISAKNGDHNSDIYRVT